MNAQVRNFRAKFRAKFRENRTFRTRTLYRPREIRTLWHILRTLRYLAQDTTAPDTLGECLAPREGGAAPSRSDSHEPGSLSRWMRAAKLTEEAEPPPNRPMAGGICVGARRCAAGRVTVKRLAEPNEPNT